MISRMRHGTQWWMGISAVLMSIGAFGPWVTWRLVEMSGVYSFNGSIVLAAAVVGGALVLAVRRSPVAGCWALAAGVAGIAVMVNAYSRIEQIINRGQALRVQPLAQVGWGFELA